MYCTLLSSTAVSRETGKEVIVIIIRCDYISARRAEGPCCALVLYGSGQQIYNKDAKYMVPGPEQTLQKVHSVGGINK